MTDMIERVARAVFSVQADGWDGLSDAERDDYRADARAAIAAMREPTAEMVSLMTAADIGALAGFASMREIWAAGIDAALDAHRRD